MNAIGHFFIAVLAIALQGCAWRFAPGFSMHDTGYFTESPYIVQRGNDYFLRWRYGNWGFYFFPESRLRNGTIIFSLQATSSSGSVAGKVGEIRIEGEAKIHALETGGAFWWEPDGQKIPLKIVKEMSNNRGAGNGAVAIPFQIGCPGRAVPDRERWVL